LDEVIARNVIAVQSNFPKKLFISRSPKVEKQSARKAAACAVMTAINQFTQTRLVD
jgi:hypothetical protein